MKLPNASVWRRAWLLSILSLFWVLPMRGADFTAKDGQGVIYDIIDGTDNVVVSQLNKNEFSNKYVDLTIPVSFVDQSTTGTGKTFTVVGMAEEAFNSTAVHDVTILASIPEIPRGAFQDCWNLGNIKVQGATTKVCEDAFNWAGGNDAVVELPSTVSYIGDHAFKNTWGIIQIDAPGVTELGKEVFYSSSDLTTVNLSDNLKVIPENTFYYCDDLTNFTLPANLEEIGEYAFYGCNALTLTNQWPASLKKINNYAFQYCESLGSIKLSADIEWGRMVFQGAGFTTIDWGNEYIPLSESFFKQCKGYKNFAPPAWMTYIPRNFFERSELETVTMHERVDSIDTSAFESCSSLSQVTFSDGIKYIGGSSFGSCSNLKSVKIPAGVIMGPAFDRSGLTSIEFPEEPFVCDNDMFLGQLQKMEKITLPGYLKRLPPYAINQWYALKELTLGEGFELIDREAIENSSSLVTLNLPSSLKTIKKKGIYYCTNLAELNITATDTIVSGAFEYLSNLKKLTLNSAYVDEKILVNCKNVEELHFNGYKVDLHPDAFGNIHKIKTLDFQVGVEHIYDYAFSKLLLTSSDPGRLFTINLPEGLKSIGKYAFSNFTHRIGMPVLPQSLEVVDDYAFYNSANYFYYSTDLDQYPMVPFKLPNIKKIGNHAFDGVCLFSEITLPESECELGEFAFKGNQVNHVVFPEWVKKVPAGFLAQNYQLSSTVFNQTLKYVEFKGQIEEIGDSAFVGSGFTTLCLPDYPVKLGKYVYANSQSLSNITLPDWLTEFPEGLFCDCGNLFYVGNLYKVTSFGARSMANTDWSNQLVIAFRENVKFIGKEAFAYTSYGDQKFKTYDYGVTIPETTELDEYALAGSRFNSFKFEGCRELPTGCLANTRATTIEYPSCMTEIPDSLFYGSAMYGRNNLYITPQIKKIGRSAFSNIELHPGESEDGSHYFDIDLSNVEEIGDSAFCKITCPIQGYVVDGIRVKWPENRQPKMGSSIFQENTLFRGFEIPACWDSVPKRMFYYPYDAYGGAGYSIERFTFEERTGVNADRELIIGEAAFENALHGVLFVDFKNYKIRFRDDAFRAGNFDIAGVDNFLELGKGSFWGNGIKTLNLPGSFTEIPEHCFAASRALTSLTLGEGITKIDNSAFASCSVLTSVNLPSSVRYLGDEAFSKDTKITKITFNGPIDYIGSDCFYRCDALTELVFPYHVGELAGKLVSFDSNQYVTNMKLTKVKFTSGPEVIPANTFYNAKVLETVEFDNETRTIRPDAFVNCPKLKEVRLPDSLQVLQKCIFNNCTVEKLDLGNGLKRIETEAMMGAKINALRWCNALEYVGKYAFSNTQITELEIPDGFNPPSFHGEYISFGNTKYYGMDEDIFNGNTKLTTVKFGDVNRHAIAKKMFQKCTALTTVDLGKLEYVPEYCFSGCTKLNQIDLTSVALIDSCAFNGCSGLISLKLGHPESVTVKKRGFYNCSGLTDVTVNSPECFLDNNAFGKDSWGVNTALTSATFSGKARVFGGFRECTKLKTVTAGGDLEAGRFAFYNCKQLQKLDLPTLTSLTLIEEYAFQNCTNLADLPYLPYIQRGLATANYAFNNCQQFNQVTMPADGVGNFAQETFNGRHPRGIFQECSNLQSFIYPHTASAFHLAYEDIMWGAPLEAISYAYAENIPMSPYRRISPFMEEYQSYYGQKSKLMVARGQKWKYMEMGYDKRFEIEEMKDPKIDIVGDIHSTYDKASNRNHYNAYLMWELPLSDLNQNDATTARIFRWDDKKENKEKIVEMTFSKPSEPFEDSRYPGRRVKKVEVTLSGNITDCTFSGDMEYPVIEADGSQGFRVVNATQESTLLFDADSEKRLDTFDKDNYTSWFLLKDEFWSPVIGGEEPLPETYTYSAEVDSYSYETFVNREGLEKDPTTGLRYKSATRFTPANNSKEVTMTVIRPVPTLDGPGYLTYDQVLGDKGMIANATRGFEPTEDFAIGFSLDPEIAAQKGIAYEGTDNNEEEYFVATSAQLVKIQPDGSGEYVGGVINLNGTPTASVPVTDLDNITTGTQFIVVVHSRSRGDFASPMVKIPDLPSMTASLTTQLAPHAFDAGHLNALPILAKLEVKPDATNLGYGNKVPTDKNYHLGVWRHSTEMDALPTQFSEDDEDSPAMISRRDDDVNLMLVHHVDGLEANHTNCSECAQQQSVSVSDEAVNVNHVFDINQSGTLNSTYAARLYVKIPSSYIPGDERWVAVDATATANLPILSGVEEVSVDVDSLEADGEVTWYSLQGYRVENPVKGQIYIRVTPQGNSVVKF